MSHSEPVLWLGVVSVLPEMFDALASYGVTGRAVQTGRVVLHRFNPRDFVLDGYRRVDDRPYGGGPGMVMMAEPLQAAIAAAKAQAARDGCQDVPVLCMSPQGRVLRQPDVQEMACQRALIVLCGRYEGIDERLIAQEVDAEWSIGDYVVSGGELPAMVLLDALIRLQDHVLGDADSADQDSFSHGLLDCPHYTRPPEWAGMDVPEVLRSGDHAAIARWRFEQQCERTRQRRPDLWDLWRKTTDA